MYYIKHFYSGRVRLCAARVKRSCWHPPPAVPQCHYPGYLSDCVMLVTYVTWKWHTIGPIFPVFLLFLSLKWRLRKIPPTPGRMSLYPTLCHLCTFRGSHIVRPCYIGGHNPQTPMIYAPDVKLRGTRVPLSCAVGFTGSLWLPYVKGSNIHYADRT